jgi:hypothetical protein
MRTCNSSHSLQKRLARLQDALADNTRAQALLAAHLRESRSLNEEARHVTTTYKRLYGPLHANDLERTYEDEKREEAGI